MATLHNDVLSADGGFHACSGKRVGNVAPNHSLQLPGHPPRDRFHQQDVQCLCRRVGVAGPQLS